VTASSTLTRDSDASHVLLDAALWTAVRGEVERVILSEMACPKEDRSAEAGELEDC
jgi:hypothetical protein